jgi:hypothetical protein
VITDTIYAALSAVAPTFANVAGDSQPVPYMVFQRIATVAENTLADGQSIQHTRFQVDVYEATYEAVQALAQLAINAALALPQCVQLLEQDLYEGVVKLHRVSLDFSIWHASA